MLVLASETDADDLESSADAWSRARERLRQAIKPDVYESWFEQLRFVSADGGRLHVSAATAFSARFVKSGFAAAVMEAWRSAGGAEIDSVFVSARGPMRRPEQAAPNVVPLHADEDDARRQKPRTTPEWQTSPIDVTRRIDGLVRWPGNNLAVWAVSTLIGGKAKPSAHFSPIVISGAPGSGKTHILHAAANAVIEQGRCVAYLTAEDFSYGFAARRSNVGMGERSALGSVDVLIIDDIHHVGSGKPTAVLERALAYMDAEKKQVIVAMRGDPGEVAQNEAIYNALAKGVLAHLAPTDRAASLKVAQLAAHQYEVELDAEVIEIVARKLHGDPGNICTAVMRASVASTLLDQPVTAAAMEEICMSLAGAPPPPTVDRIREVVCRHFGVSVNDMISARRTKALVKPRQIAMYLAKTLTPRSLPEIGRRFGDRDHTTVLHAVGRIRGRLDDGEKEIVDAISILRTQLGA